jgi:hypothetical protein
MLLSDAQPMCAHDTTPSCLGQEIGVCEDQLQQGQSIMLRKIFMLQFVHSDAIEQHKSAIKIHAKRFRKVARSQVQATTTEDRPTQLQGNLRRIAVWATTIWATSGLLQFEQLRFGQPQACCSLGYYDLGDLSFTKVRS